MGFFDREAEESKYYTETKRGRGKEKGKASEQEKDIKKVTERKRSVNHRCGTLKADCF